MNTHTLASLFLAGLLSMSPALSLAVSTSAADAGGSALPPGINPTTPAGGNGGDADGLEKKPANPQAPGKEKKAAPSKSTEKPASTVHKKSTAPKQ
ncbi:hypothetical protein [Pseudomonas sp. NPDC090201]|jgi:hypothetical protein|uniref:hypothetical protein n=1 Tax=Pseudomonas sp. NPDC090201 TaxID=3364475 RepID=UPI00382AF15F